MPSERRLWRSPEESITDLASWVYYHDPFHQRNFGQRLIFHAETKIPENHENPTYLKLQILGNKIVIGVKQREQAHVEEIDIPEHVEGRNFFDVEDSVRSAAKKAISRLLENVPKNKRDHVGAALEALATDTVKGVVESTLQHLEKHGHVRRLSENEFIVISDTEIPRMHGALLKTFYVPKDVKVYGSPGHNNVILVPFTAEELKKMKPWELKDTIRKRIRDAFLDWAYKHIKKVGHFRPWHTDVHMNELSIYDGHEVDLDPHFLPLGIVLGNEKIPKKVAEAAVHVLKEDGTVLTLREKKVLPGEAIPTLVDEDEAALKEGKYNVRYPTGPGEYKVLTPVDPRLGVQLGPGEIQELMKRYKDDKEFVEILRRALKQAKRKHGRIYSTRLRKLVGLK